MIIWLTGQPGAGKTTLAKMLVNELEEYYDAKIFHVDGDDLRKLTLNMDYSEQGRLNNINGAQKIAHYLHNDGHLVIVSLVSPYRWQREELKKQLGNNLFEIYVHTSDVRERDNFKVSNYEEPLENFLDIDTTFDDEIDSITKIMNEFLKITKV